MTATMTARRAAYGEAAARSLGTTCEVLTTDPAMAPIAMRLMQRRLVEADLAASRFRPDSEVMRLAARADGGPVVDHPVGALLMDLIQSALRVARLTDGLVTPLIGRALEAAGYDQDLDAVRRATVRGGPASIPADWRQLRVHPVHGTVSLPAGSLLDLGASAKARLADRIAGELEERLGGGFLVDLGGDIACAGAAPDGGWSIGVRTANGQEFAGIRTSHQAIATSSTALRTWRAADGGTAHHIMDPRTGRPAETPWETVTVVARNALEANAASTAGIILGDQAPRWLSDRRLPALLIARDGTQQRTPGWPS